MYDLNIRHGQGRHGPCMSRASRHLDMNRFRFHAFRQLAASALGAAALLLLFSETARAQLKPNIRAIDRTQITRNEPLRGINDFPYWVSRADCIKDDEITFSVQVTTPNTDNFEVWAGAADCTQLAQRQGDQATCWRVFSGSVVKSPADITLRARDIVAKNGPSNGSTGVPGTEEDCNSQEYVKLGLYFMYINDAGAVSSNTVVFNESGIDLEGPISPNITEVAPSDNRLLIRWEESNPGEFAGYRIYCADAVEVSTTSTALTLLDGAVVDGAVVEGAAVDGAALENTALSDTTANDTNVTSPAGRDTAVEAGAISVGDGGDVGTDAGGPTTPTGCGGSVLIEGELPPTSRLCGTVDTFSKTSAYAPDLQNGRRYAVGITAVDRLGNESPLSNVLCNSPREVYTFFEDYRAAGGDGGGGFCSFAPLAGSHSNGWQWAALLTLALGFGIFRRTSNT